MIRFHFNSKNFCLLKVLKLFIYKICMYIESEKEHLYEVH